MAKLLYVTSTDYFSKTFSQEEIDKLIKDFSDNGRFNVVGHVNLNQNNETKWTGDTGEITFKKYLDENNIQHTYHNLENVISSKDFTIGKLKIDVKTIPRSVYPLPHYACNVPDHQMHKITDGTINTLVFATYVIPQKLGLVNGFISVDDFMKNKEFHEKGEKVGIFKYTTDTHIVFINQLRPITEIENASRI